MTKRDLQEAYDRMSPSQETKMRMLSNILPQEKGKGKHHTRPQERRRWTAVPAMLALAAVLAAGWWMLMPGVDTPASIDPSERAEASEPEVIHHDILDLEECFPDVQEEYQEILGRYYMALAGECDETYWKGNGLNTAAYAWLDVMPVGLGYALMDLDNNGSSELLITDGDQIYDLYTIIDGDAHELLGNKIHSGGKRLSVKLCEDNLVMVWQQLPQADYYTSWYQLGKDGLGTTALTSIETVLSLNTGAWYAGPNEKEAVEVTEAQAREILNSREPVSINMVPICPEIHKENTHEIPEGYGYILEKMVRAYSENWTAGEYMENDISYVLKNLDITAGYGYALMDLDSNGVEELLITDGELIYDLFTLMEDGGPGHILSAGERLRYFLCEDNVIGYRGSSGAANSVLEFYQLKNGMDLIPVERLVFETDGWYRVVSDSGDCLVAITEEEVQRVEAFYNAVEIPFQPLLRDEPAQEKIFADTYAEALREKIKENPDIVNMFMSLVDVSGDGVSELLLGTSDSFGQIFTLADGRLKEVLTYGTDEGFTLCADGIVAYHTPEPYGQYTFISVKNNQPDVVDEILYDKEAGKWFRYKTTGKEYFKDYQINDLLASYCPLSVTMVPVADYLAGA